MDKKVLDIATIIETLKYAQNQGIKIKVNTVISKLNIDEDIIPLYEAIHFDRVKLLQVRIQGNCNETAQKYEISAESFNLYTDKIKRLNPNIIIESESEIESSYIIIDPLGHLISNQNNYHKQVGSIFKEKLEDLIIEAGIQYKLFSKRYTLIDNDNKPMNHNDKTVERFK